MLAKEPSPIVVDDIDTQKDTKGCDIVKESTGVGGLFLSLLMDNREVLL